jgi:hypothetical protein
MCNERLISAASNHQVILGGESEHSIGVGQNNLAENAASSARRDRVPTDILSWLTPPAENPQRGNLSADLTRSTPVGAFSATHMRYAVLTLAVLGLAIRALYLGTHHLWTDELSTMRFVQLPISQALDYLRTVEGQPPGAFLLTKALSWTFFGLLTPDQLKYIVLLWFAMIGAAAWFVHRRHPRIGLPVVITLGFIAVSPLAAYIGSEARPYSLFMAVAFLLLIAAASWSDLVISAPYFRNRHVVSMAALMALTAAVNYSGIVLAVSIIITLQSVAFARDRQLDPALLRASILAGVLYLPVLPILLPQLDNNQSTASTPWDQIAHYFAWAMGGLGIGLLLLSGVVLTIRIARRNRPDTEANRSQHPDLAAGIILLTTILFVIGAGLVKLVTGVQLINIGMAVIPPICAIFGLALLTAPRLPRSAVAILISYLVFTVPVTLGVTESPSVISRNRVSTVDVMIRVAPVVGYDVRGGDGALLMSVDRALTNEYFVARSADLYPSALVGAVYIEDSETKLQALLQSGLDDPSVDYIVLFTRNTFDAWVLPHIPNGVRVIKVDEYAWVLEPDIQP